MAVTPQFMASLRTNDYEKAAELHGLEVPPQNLEKRAADLVIEHRKAIDLVAEALLEHETLPGDESTVVASCVDDNSDWRVVLLRYRELKHTAWLHHRCLRDLDSEEVPDEL